MRITPALLDHLAEALVAVLRFDRPADKALSDYFHEHRTLGHAERGFIAEAVYAALREKLLLEAAIAEAGPLKPDARPTRFAQAREFALATLVRVQKLNLRELGDSLRANEQEWLGKVKGAARENLPLDVRTGLPQWVLSRLADRYSESELLALGEALNRPAPLDLRVNLLKAKRDDVLRRFADEGIEAKPTPYSPVGIRLAGKPALHRHPLFLDGSVEVQDEGSQLLAYLLAPHRGEMVADFCAGAGGKTLAMAALMRSTGRLYAFDVSEKRLARLKPRLARSGASNIDSRAMASENDPKLGRLRGKLDRVLVDAPCSGLGTVRRNPDLKWRQNESALDELSAKQGSILAAAAKLVKPGGRLVYATCSVLPQENEAVVESFLNAHPDFAQLDAAEVLRAQDIPLEPGGEGFLRLTPVRHQTDAFFAAALERKR